MTLVLERRRRRLLVRGGLLAALLLAVVVVPFLLLEARAEAVLAGLSALDRGAFALGVAAALTADIFLPVPSSILVATAGAVLGPFLGALVGTVGLTFGCWLGYETAARLGAPSFRAVLGAADAERFSAFAARHAALAIVLTRAVPVLAEATVLTAGAARAGRGKVLLWSLVANFGFSATLAWLGAAARDQGSFSAAWLGVVGLSAAAFLVAKLVARRPGRTAGLLVALAAVAAAGRGGPASAQTADEPAVELAPLEVTASRTAPSLEALGGTVVDAADLERLQPVTVLEALDRVAGVRAFSKGGVGGGAFLSVRGGEPNFTLVLIEGVKVNDPTNSQGGAFDLAQIDPQAVERIEVARGGLSAVHGADALSGVVNLRLRTLGAGERVLSGWAQADTAGGLGGGATAGMSWKGGGGLVNVGAYDSGDWSPGSELSRAHALVRARQRFGALDFAAFVLHAGADRTAFAEDSGGPRLAVVRERETRETALTVAAVDLGLAEPGRVRPHLAVNWARQTADTDTPPIAAGVLDGTPRLVADTGFDRFEALADVTVEARADLVVAAGAGLVRETGDSDGFIDLGFPLPAGFSIGRQSLSGYAEATFTPRKNLMATAAVRYDDPSSADGRWTGRLAGRAGPAYGSVSTGYKLPSLYALAHPLIGNPGLRPERSRGFELGLDRSLAGGGRARLAYFHTRFEDLIDFDPQTFTTVNRAQVRVHGLEAELAAPLSPLLWFEGALTWLEVDTDPGTPPLRSRPRWQGSASLDWQASGRLGLSATLAYNGGEFDSSIPTGLVRLPPRLELGASVRWALSDAVAVRLTGHNLLDETAEQTVGFPPTGRELRLSLAGRF